MAYVILISAQLKSSLIRIYLPVGQSDLGRLTWAEEYRWFESNQVDHLINLRLNDHPIYFGE